MAPKGLKTTSSPLQISASVSESALNTFSTEEIPLTLNVLDNEVFVVTQINLDVQAPSAPGTPGNSASVSASLSTTARTSVGSIANANVLGASERIILSSATHSLVGFDREDPLFSAISEDYLGIVATNNMFLNIQANGSAIGQLKNCRVRVYGYRASASASVYAALVQSELLSA